MAMSILETLTSANFGIVVCAKVIRALSILHILAEHALTSYVLSSFSRNKFEEFHLHRKLCRVD